ncbi:hypothetical protein MRX96_051108 [Rhipicephalus microplus]
MYEGCLQKVYGKSPKDVDEICGSKTPCVDFRVRAKRTRAGEVTPHRREPGTKDQRDWRAASLPGEIHPCQEEIKRSRTRQDKRRRGASRRRDSCEASSMPESAFTRQDGRAPHHRPPPPRPRLDPRNEGGG